MVRALILTTLICVCSVLCRVDARWTIKPKYSTTTMTPTTTTTSTTVQPTTTTTTKRATVQPTAFKWTTVQPTTSKWATVRPTAFKWTTVQPATSKWPTVPQLPVGVVGTVPKPLDDESFYHPTEGNQPRLVEQHDHRYLDGHYEYRYVLSNGDTRYESSYWQRVGNKKQLLRKGFYSYPLPNNHYLTVYYTADENGFHQDLSTYSPERPVLPRSLVVPESDPPTMKEIMENNKQILTKLQTNQSTKPTTTVGPKVKTVAIDNDANDVVAGTQAHVAQAAQDEVVVPQQQIPTTAELRKIMAQLDAEILTAAKPTTAKHEQPQDAIETVNKVGGVS